MKKNIAVISVRFNSKRLPGKALKKYKNKNSIDRIFESLRKNKQIDASIIALQNKDNLIDTKDKEQDARLNSIDTINTAHDASLNKIFNDFGTQNANNANTLAGVNQIINDQIYIF